MICIKKNNEPKSWVKYRETQGVDYAATQDLRQSLLEEQGYICAFCMRRIPVKDGGEAETSKVAHLLTRTNHPDRKLDYKNMVVCCPGNIDGEHHCDKSQGSTDITLPIFSQALQDTISYNPHTGEIKSSNEDWNTQIVTVLNLNTKKLCTNRCNALEGVRKTLEKNKWKRAKLEEQLRTWENFDNNGKLKSYCGVAIWYIRKKLKQVR